MRRKDREITDKTEIEKIIQKALVCRVDLSDGDSPYSDKAYEFPEPSLDQVAIIKIRVESMTGKKAALGG